MPVILMSWMRKTFMTMSWGGMARWRTTLGLRDVRPKVSSLPKSLDGGGWRRLVSVGR